MKKRERRVKRFSFLVEVETDRYQVSDGWETYVRLALIGMMIPVTKVTKVGEATLPPRRAGK